MRQIWNSSDLIAVLRSAFVLASLSPQMPSSRSATPTQLLSFTLFIDAFVVVFCCCCRRHLLTSIMPFYRNFLRLSNSNNFSGKLSKGRKGCWRSTGLSLQHCLAVAASKMVLRKNFPLPVFWVYFWGNCLKVWSGKFTPWRQAPCNGL